jgi:hypothetical protein
MIEQETSPGHGAASRRSLLRLLGLGGVASVAAFAARPAHAQDTTTTAPTSPGDPGGTTTSAATTTTPVATTTPPPRAPTDSDRNLLAALKTVELTATHAYAVMTPRLTQLGYDEPTTSVLAILEPHHRAYAESLSGLFGPGLQVGVNESVLQALQAEQLANGDAAAVLATAQSIEDTILDTYLNALDSIESTDFAALAASILIVQARHAAVLGNLQGQPYDASSPAEEDGADALTLAELAGDA